MDTDLVTLGVVPVEDFYSVCGINQSAEGTEKFGVCN